MISYRDQLSKAFGDGRNGFDDVAEQAFKAVREIKDHYGKHMSKIRRIDFDQTEPTVSAAYLELNEAQAALEAAWWNFERAAKRAAG